MQIEVSQLGFLLIALAPFVAAAMAAPIKRYAGALAGWVLAIVPGAIFLQLLLFLPAIASGQVVRAGLPWISGLGPQIDFSFYLDGLSLTFALLISGIGTLIIIYSGGYLAGHKHQGRFFAFMLAFMGSMLGLVLADSIPTLFVFWELTTITSFLLIGFDHHRQAARRGAIQALVITGGGGLLLLAGLAMMGILHNNWSIANMLSASGFVQQSPRYMPIMLLVVLGAFTKSAIVPFHFWLPNAMEAPTPVSAFLHSATMVKAGVYLLARMNPILGGTPAWQTILIVAGGATLLVGAVLALRHTDMKQMLAYTTIGMLGLLTMLIGAGSTAAITAMILLLIAHAFYKGALFLIVGTVEHQAGTRDITHVSGLARAMPVSALAAILAAASMAGVPIAIGYYGKEELYTLVAGGNFFDPVVVLVALIGNAMMLAVGLAIAIRAFFGAPPQTPIIPREGSPSLLLGGLALGILGIAAGYYVHELGLLFVAPMLASIAGEASAVDLDIWHFVPVLLALSVITWGLGGLAFWFLSDIRMILRRVAQLWSWGPDRGFDQAMVTLIRASARITNSIQHGRLEGYLALILGTLAAVTLVPLLIAGFPSLPPIPDLALHEWGIMALAAVGLVAVVLARTRLATIVSLGIQGFAVAIIFLIYGAPDLSFTQFMVEILSVVILALVMTRLNLDLRNRRLFENVVRDGAIAILAGVGLSALLVVVLSLPLDQRLAEFFTANSVTHGHGRNIVNVILVDFRALDTLGEITVVMAAGIAVFALIASAGSAGRTAPQPTIPKKAAPKKRRSRRAASSKAGEGAK